MISQHLLSQFLNAWSDGASTTEGCSTGCWTLNLMLVKEVYSWPIEKLFLRQVHANIK